MPPRRWRTRPQTGAESNSENLAHEVTLCACAIMRLQQNSQRSCRMSDLTCGLFVRGQYHAGDDMRKRFEEVKAQVRLADQLGFSDLLTGMHYAAAPLQQYQLIPLLARLLGETERMRIITGIILLSLHKPLDIAEQLATLDVMSNGRLVFGAGLGYRDVEFKAFGTTAQERVQRLEENLEAIKRLWTEDDVSMKGSHFE